MPPRWTFLLVGRDVALRAFALAPCSCFSWLIFLSHVLGRSEADPES